MNKRWILFTLALAVVAAIFHPRPANGAKIYWADAGTGKIQRANLDGTGVEDLVTGETAPNYVAFDPIEQIVFWTSGVGSGPEFSDQIHRANADGSDTQSILDPGDELAGLVLEPFQRKLYVLDWTGEGIFFMNLDGTAADGSDLSFSNPFAFALDPFRQRGYVINGHGTHIDGFDYDLTRSSQMVLCTDCVDSDAHALAIDPLRGHLYYGPIFPEGDELFARVNLDGTGRTSLIEAGQSAFALAIDVAGEKLYWTDPVEGVIRRADLDGTNIETIVTGLTDPRGIALDILPVPEPSTITLTAIGLMFRVISPRLRCNKSK